jgi:hypothetical protein
MRKASSFSRIWAWGMLLPKFFDNRHASMFWEKVSKLHTLSLIDGPQGDDSGPEAVGSLGHEHQDL